MAWSLVGANVSQLSNGKFKKKKRFESTNLSAAVMKRRNDQRKLAHAGTMGLSSQCTCKIPQRDVHPHVWLMGGTGVGSSGPRPDRHSCPPRARVNTHLRSDAHAGTHSHPPPARPPGLDDLLNSSNYQALTDRQIRPEQGCWGLHSRSEIQNTDTKRQTWFPQRAKQTGKSWHFTREFCH